MTDKDLKKLSRAELLEILIVQTQENERLSVENETLKKQLEDRRIIIDNAGSIADASMKLNGVFEAAQEAARDYVESIKLYCERQEKATVGVESEVGERTAQLLSDAEKKADAIVSTAQARADRIILDAEKRARMNEMNCTKECEKMKRNAQKEAESYWNRISKRLDEYISMHPELKDAVKEKRI